MSKILSFGAIVWDIIEGVPYIGGAPFNLAAHAASCGLEAHMLTSLGTDEFGDRSIVEMQRLDVGRSYVQRDPLHDTATVVVTLSEDGQPSYDIKDDVSYDHIAANEQLLERIERERVTAFCFGTIEQRAHVTRETLHKILPRLAGAHVLFDVNLRLDYYSPRIITDSLEHTTILKLNSEEVRVLSEMLYQRPLAEDEFAARVRDDYHIKTVLVTRGEHGCMLVADGILAEMPGIPVDVADTVGAGDAFGAGFLAGLCRGKSSEESARFANRLGAFVASRRGAIPPYDDEIMELIRANHGANQGE